MIRVRPLPLDNCGASYLAPFIQRRGHIPVPQLPQLARILAEDGSVLGYEFIRGRKQAGYVVIKVRHRILADITFGPVVLDNEDFIACVNALKPVLRLKGLLVLRILPPFGAPACQGLSAHFNWATSVVDISRSEEDILKSFSPNHRQSIRKAIEANFLIRLLNEDELALYARGYVAMFARRGISKDAAGTLRLLREIHKFSRASNDEAFILAAFQNGTNQIIGGGIFFCSGDTCTYYQGYAERTSPPQPVLHLVLWEAIRRAKAIGCVRFDLSGYSLDDSDRQLKAVNDFKRWFRGEIIHYPDTVVIPLYPLIVPMLRLIGKRI